MVEVDPADDRADRSADNGECSEGRALERVVSMRQDLHQIPELDHDLPETLAYVRAKLEGFGCSVQAPTPSSLAVFFDFGQADAIAFRADMDGLPVSEQVDHPWQSRHPGKMHACGHDGHMAMLLELCAWLQEHLQGEAAGADSTPLPHNYLAIFQPAEESSGGAKDICETGIFQRCNVKAVFGLHMWPGLPAGEVHSRPGELMARSSEVTIDIRGKGTHIAKAAQGHDALHAAAMIAAQAIELEQTSYRPDVLRLLRFGLLQAGTAQNVIASSALLRGTLRAFSDPVYDHLRAGLQQICERAAATTGCSVDLHVATGYPPVLNDADLFARVRDFDPTGRLHLLAEPHMTSEDFSFYQQLVPGVFFFLGTGKDAALHSHEFDMDEATLAGGVDFLKALTRIPL